MSTAAMTSTTLVMDSPVGAIQLVSMEESLVKAHFIDDGDSAPQPDGVTPVLAEARRQFEGYFAGELQEFDLPLAPFGTAFQKRVWAQLVQVPYGETVSYGEIARRLGLPPGASRAVGSANGKNPIAIIVPCHRVIGADGTLTGYAGGLPRKRALLDIEAKGAGRPTLFS